MQEHDPIEILKKEIVEAVKKGEKHNGNDSIAAAIQMQLDIDGENPVFWAVKEGRDVRIYDYDFNTDTEVLLRSENPLIYSLKTLSYEKNKTTLAKVEQYCREGNELTINSKKYTYEQFHEGVVEAIKQDAKGDFGFEEVRGSDLIKLTINGNFQIEGQPAIEWLVKNHRNPKSAINVVYREHDNEENIALLCNLIKENPNLKNERTGENIIELCMQNLGGVDEYRDAVVDVIDREAIHEFSDGIMDIYIKRQLDLGKNSLPDLPDKYKDQALLRIANLYIDPYECTGKKSELKEMHQALLGKQAEKLLGLDSELGKFTANPEECAQKIDDILKKATKIDKPKIDLETGFDMLNLVKSTDLDVLKNIKECGEKLQEKAGIHEPKKGFSAAVWVLAVVIGVLPAIILGIKTMVDNANEKKDLEAKKQEVESVIPDIDKIAKGHDLAVGEHHREHRWADKFPHKEGVHKFAEGIKSAMAEKHSVGR